jgi:BspA type Leucine rich repeat region (6 copies)
MRNHLLTIASTCLLALPLSGWAQFTFTINNGTITITGYTGPGGDVTIPSITNGYPVTSIGDRAFFNGQQIYFRLTSITIPDSVTNIGNSAFYNCYNLTNVSLGAGVVTIGTNAFQGCSSLTNIFLPASVTSIGNQAFIACANLLAINVDAGNPAYSSVAGILFDRNQTTLIECPGGQTGSIVVSNTVTGIGNWAFAYCVGITNITLPASVTNIGFEAFMYCTRLAAIAVDTNNPAFSSLDGVLFDRPAATLIQYPEGRTGAYDIPDGVTSIADEAFYFCTNLTGVVIPDGVVSIGNSAFYYCNKLVTATIPDSLTNVGDSAFYYCPSLTSAITLGDNLRHLGNFAFGYCSGLTSVTVGNGITSIGDSVFLECIGLTNIILSGNVTSIGDAAFYYCNNLTSFTIPAGVTNLGNYAFFYCTKLSAITIPNGVTSIGISVFQNCSALKSVELPAGVANIGYNAFISSGLTNVIIPAGVTSIGINAFCDCSSLQSVYFQGNAPAPVDSSSFLYSPVSTVYALPGTTGWTAFTATTGLSVTPWLLPRPTILNFEPDFDIQTIGFGFTVSWATNAAIVVEASTNLQNWTPVITNTLVNGTNAFGDSEWTNYPQRFYRVRSQ